VPKDEVERHAGALRENEADLYQSSTPSLAHRRRDHRDRSNRLLDALGDAGRRATMRTAIPELSVLEKRKTYDNGKQDAYRADEPQYVRQTGP